MPISTLCVTVNVIPDIIDVTSDTDSTILPNVLDKPNSTSDKPFVTLKTVPLIVRVELLSRPNTDFVTPCKTL